MPPDPPQAAAYLLTQLHSLTTFKNASGAPLMYTCMNCSLATISVETPTATTDFSSRYSVRFLQKLCSAIMTHANSSGSFQTSA